MFDFKKFRDGFTAYIDSAFPAYAQAYSLPPHFLTAGFLDFDKHKNNFQIFADFEAASFPENRQFADDCSGAFEAAVSLWLVLRNMPPEKLDERLLNAASAMAAAVGACEKYAKIRTEKIDFFKYVEGNAHLVSARMRIKVTAE